MLYPLFMLMSFFTVCDNFTKSNVMIILYVQQLITWCRSQVGIFIARKWSLGQGNVFTPVCHSVHRGVYPSIQWGRHPPPKADMPSLGRHLPQADSPHSDTTGYSQQVGGTHPTGIHTCFFSEHLVIHLCIQRLITFVEKYSAMFDCEHYNS